jgi:hypothetical protein
MQQLIIESLSDYLFAEIVPQNCIIHNKEKIPTVEDTIVSNKGRYYGAGCPVAVTGNTATVTGLDLHFLPMAENRGSHQCLHWWQELSTGQFHCYGFESASNKE